MFSCVGVAILKLFSSIETVFESKSLFCRLWKY